MEHMGPYLQSFLPFAQKRLGFNRPPTIFFDSDAENAQQILGKTGYYDPDALEIVIFVDNRHPKDVLRSLSHELVHHAQNCRGDLNPEIAGETELGYAQNNTHMRGMESEAYEKGNLCMRDWEDSVKLQLQETNYVYTKGDNHKMATYDKLKERITNNVVQQLLEKVKNPGNYAGGEKQSAGVDDDGDGVPDGADSDPNDGSVQERKKRAEPRNDRGIPQRLKEDEEEALDALEEEEEIEERKKRDSPRNDRGIPQRLKETELEEEKEKLDKEAEEEAAAEAAVSEAKEKENLDEWYQRELYDKLIARWTH
jgi:hypothetical protein